MDDVLGRIPPLLAARYPLIWIISAEEERVERGIERLAQQHELPLWRWRSTTGLTRASGPPDPETRNALVALERISAQESSALFLFEDFGGELADRRVVRRLKDLVRELEVRRQALMVLGADVPVPPEIEKDVVMLDVPLPGRAEVGRLLSVLLRAQRIELPPPLVEQFVTASMGLTEKEVKRAFARVLIDGNRFAVRDVDLLLEEKSRLIRKSKYLEFIRSDTEMKGVGGLDNLKEWLRQRSAAFGERARAFGLPEPKGLFLLGVQGCGKSLTAKAVGNYWRVPLLRLDVASLFSGRAEEGLRDTIRIAESLAPVVLWIDEIEKAFLGDTTGNRVFGALLTWMQEKEKPVFVVATANEVRGLPPELLRKGRFDDIFFVDLPNVHERLEILDIHVRRKGRQPESYDLLAVAEDTEKYSGAELEQLVIAAMFRAFAAGRELSQDDLIKTVRDTVPLAVTMDDRLKDLREWARPRARPASVDTRRIAFFSDWEEG